MTAEETVKNNNPEKPASGAGPATDAPVGPGGADTAAATRLPADDSRTDEAAEGLDFGQERMLNEQKAEADLASTDPEDAAQTDSEARLAAANARADENWERVLRMQADMENQRKRAQKDVTSARKFALEGMINDLLPIRDSLEMGIAAARETETSAEKIIEGSDLTLTMLTQAFEKYNIIAIDPLGQKFDPEFHQAMSMQTVEGREPNTVTSVLQKGYTLNERLLRPALVMVAK